MKPEFYSGTYSGSRRRGTRLLPVGGRVRRGFCKTRGEEYKGADSFVW